MTLRLSDYSSSNPPYYNYFLSDVLILHNCWDIIFSEWCQCHHQSRRSSSLYMLKCVKRHPVSSLLTSRQACMKHLLRRSFRQPQLHLWPQLLRLTWHQWLHTILRVGFAQQAYILLALMRSGDVMRPRDPKRAWWGHNVFHCKVAAGHTWEKKENKL